MMQNPKIGKLLSDSDSAYSLVIAVAKRSRDIAESAEEKHMKLTDKPVNLAIDEFVEHKAIVITPEDGESVEL